MPLVYVFHIGFYALFLLRAGGRRTVAEAGAPPAAAGGGPPSAPHPVRLLVLHAAAFFVFYFGLGHTLFSRRGTRLLLAPHPILGGAVIVAGGALLAWALRVFRSWRLLARIEPGHQLCTIGPFCLVRHPIYVSLDLLALGTFLWVPSLWVLAGAILVILAGDLRARSEERLLRDVFGEEYRRYQEGVARTIPRLY